MLLEGNDSTLQVLSSGTVLGTKVQKGHKRAFFHDKHHYTESKLSLLYFTLLSVKIKNMHLQIHYAVF